MIHIWAQITDITPYQTHLNINAYLSEKGVKCSKSARNCSDPGLGVSHKQRQYGYITRH